MRRPSCRQIEPLLAAHVADELAADESAAIAVHLDVCDSCRELARVWSGLPAVAREAELEQLPADVEQRLTNGIPAAALAQRPGRARWAVGLGLAAAAAVGVGVLAVWLALGVGETPAARGRHAVAPADGIAAEHPFQLSSFGVDERGRRVLEPAAGVTLTLEADARGWIEPGPAATRRARIEQGRALIDLGLTEPGFALEVVTPAGSIVARSAVFTVEVSAADAVRVAVEEGRVEILPDGSDGPARSLVGGDELALGEGAAPTSRGLATIEKPATKSAIEALLHRARAHRQDRDFGLASQAYEQLIRSFPGSAAARNTLVALAQMELGSMDRPTAALDHFEAYLAQAPSGTLAEEARAGRVRALHRLGRARALQRAADDYLAQHPAGRAAAEMLRRRGDAKRQQGRCDAAAGDYREVRRRWPTSPEAGHAVKGLDACGSAL